MENKEIKDDKDEADGLVNINNISNIVTVGYNISSPLAARLFLTLLGTAISCGSNGDRKAMITVAKFRSMLPYTIRTSWNPRGGDDLRVFESLRDNLESIKYYVVGLTYEVYNDEIHVVFPSSLFHSLDHPFKVV
jgi:hypothetical protein